MANTLTTNLTELDKGHIRNASLQAQESISLILRISARRSATTTDLAFPINALKIALETLARKAHLDL